jgi:3-hydroxyisobutyrate dehydrogenase
MQDQQAEIALWLRRKAFHLPRVEPFSRSNTMFTIAWIGLGLMGRPMSNHMRAAGHTVRGYDIDEEARRRARALGITISDSIAEACADADAVFTMLPAGPDVKQVLTAKDGVFANVRKDAIAVDCSTIRRRLRS